MKTNLFVPRTYRNGLSGTGKSFGVCCSDTDLWIAADPDLEPVARKAVLSLRDQLESYIARRRQFLTSLAPLPDDDNAPPLAREMMTAARQAGVGPMAAVAGAIAEAVGRELLRFTSEVIVENGGDLFISAQRPISAQVFAGRSPFSGKLAYEVETGAGSGLCTSSGTIGHSLSLGKADAVTILADTTAAADAFATAVGNMVRTKEDIPTALDHATRYPEIKGCAIILGDALGARGALRMVKI